MYINSKLFQSPAIIDFWSTKKLSLISRIWSPHFLRMWVGEEVGWGVVFVVPSPSTWRIADRIQWSALLSLAPHRFCVSILSCVIIIIVCCHNPRQWLYTLYIDIPSQEPIQDRRLIAFCIYLVYVEYDMFIIHIITLHWGSFCCTNRKQLIQFISRFGFVVWGDAAAPLDCVCVLCTNSDEISDECIIRNTTETVTENKYLSCWLSLRFTCEFFFFFIIFTENNS